MRKIIESARRLCKKTKPALLRGRCRGLGAVRPGRPEVSNIASVFQCSRTCHTSRAPGGGTKRETAQADARSSADRLSFTSFLADPLGQLRMATQEEEHEKAEKDPISHQRHRFSTVSKGLSGDSKKEREAQAKKSKEANLG